MRRILTLLTTAGLAQLLVASGVLATNTNLVQEWQLSALRQSIQLLEETYPDQYSGTAFLERLSRIELASRSNGSIATEDLDKLKQEALMAHPLLQEASLLSIKIPINPKLLEPKSNFPGIMDSIGLPDAHRSLSNLSKDAMAGQVVRIDSIITQSRESPVVQPIAGAPIAGLDLHWNADRFLFARRENSSWNIFEASVDGAGLRQVSQHDGDINAFEPCYLPGGKIVFASDACAQGVPCWHGDKSEKRVALLYTMDSDGQNIRQLCFDQGHNAQPSVLKDGRVTFNRWDYTGMNRVFNRIVMSMRPDGTNQRALFGTNTWYPNSIYGQKELPGSNRIVCIVAGYHESHRSGYLGILDPSQGDRGDAPLIKIITGSGEAPRRRTEDKLLDGVVPLFTDPEPIDDNYFLVSVLTNRDSCEFSICLADIFGNIVPIRHEAGKAYLKPTLIRSRPLPNILPDLVNLADDFSTVYIQDVYSGPGLEGVDRGTIKKIRVIAYEYGYATLAGADKIGIAGPWEVMQILGEATVHADGSALFRIPADTPVAFQMVDNEGKAVQLMRTWTTAMPGERLSCVGCHENTNTAPLPLPTIALQHEPQPLDQWHGPARGFDFTREIQPILNKNCIDCHDGRESRPDLRPRDQVTGYRGMVPSFYDRTRLDDKYKATQDGETIVPYSPAYEALVHYIRRVSIGDDVSLLVPGEYSAQTSQLIQILKKGHHDVILSPREWEALYAWIDLNAPCHGTWNEVFGVTPANDQQELRDKYRKLYNSKQVILDQPQPVEFPNTPAKRISLPEPTNLEIEHWPMDLSGLALERRTLAIGNAPPITMVRIPANPFVMGDADGYPDESPECRVDIRKAFWISETEISNAQFRAFHEGHDSRYYGKRHLERTDNKGIPLNADEQPALRVSWNDSMAFCSWISGQTGLRVNLPTEAQWEYACRGGSDTAFSFGNAVSNFTNFANVADRSFATRGITGKSGGERGLFVVASDAELLVPEGVWMSDRSHDDGFVVTSGVSSFQPNRFGLKNMHGNVAEWTRSLYRAYPYKESDGRNDLSASGDRVVRGGSCFDPPEHCRSAFRLAYPQWQKVHNVGFRIVIEEESMLTLVLSD